MGADVSEESAASIFRVESSILKMDITGSSKILASITKLHVITIQKSVTLILSAVET
jgi:hypothetical protein